MNSLFKLSDFDFILPDSKIANSPVEPRDNSRLLVYKNHQITDSVFCNINDFLPNKTVFILNDTKVFKARLNFELNGKKVEIFFVEPVEGQEQVYTVLVKPGKLFKEGFEFELPGQIRVVVLKILEDGTRYLKILSDNFDLITYLDEFGKIPLPPYIEVEDENKYSERYQTVYAKNYGSVAAPTAGLHFTDRLILKLKEEGFEFLFVTLNVGLGTFQPVRVDDISAHQMHAESFELSSETAEALNKFKEADYKLVPVGTTSLRVLQSCFDQEAKKFIAKSGSTNIFIYPGFKDFAVDALVTNFHLPKSTLFMLVSAIIGLAEAKNLYQHAIESDYRFYSFGDANLIFIK